MQQVREISREEIANLPIGQYDGDICMVDSSRELDRASEDFRSEPVVGFDTETRPSFRSSDRYLPSLLQAATAKTVYLFRLRPDSDFRVVAELLASPHTLKVGVSVADDIKGLQGLRPFEARNVLDLGELARRCGMRQTGLRNLAAIFLKVRIPKGTKTTNWAAPRLTPAQIQYAATDAWNCRELYLSFKKLGMLDRRPT